MTLEINDELVEKIILELRYLEQEYQINQALLLTEDDLKCHVFRRLYSILPNNSLTFDSNVTGSPLHSEVKFFDEHDKLTLIPDITIVSPKNISIYHSVEFSIRRKGPKYAPLPSKYFEIGGDAIILELKFCRSTKGVTDADIYSYKEDLNKIKRLQRIVTERSNGLNKLYGLVVIFNKTNLGKHLVDNFIESESDHNFNDFLNDSFICTNNKMFYGTGLIDFSTRDPYTSENGFITKLSSTQ